MLLDILFNMQKIRFNKLDELITSSCPEITRKSKINLFINLEPVLGSLVKGDIETYFRLDNRGIEMVSNIINLAAHYRLFFSKNNLYSRIFMYLNHPFNTMENLKSRSINSDYREYYKFAMSGNVNNNSIMTTSSNALNLVKIILEFVQGVYLIKVDHVESAMIPMIVNSELNDGFVNFILTKDPYEYQYVNKGYYILRPKKDNCSYIVSRNNVIECLKQESNTTSEISVDSGHLPLILSLVGNKMRCISKVNRFGISKALTVINNGINKGLIHPNIYNIHLASNCIKEELRKTVMDNYNCTDLDIQFNILNYRDKYLVTEQIKDSFDNAGLIAMNDKYFSEIPINLIELTSGDRFLK